MAADAAGGRMTDAWARADTLASEYGGSDHGLVGLGMAVRMAAQAGDLARAEAALASLTAGWPETLETASASALVRRLQEATGAGSQGGTPEGTAPVALASAAETPSTFRLLGARPNPTTGRTVVPFEVGAGTAR